MMLRILGWAWGNRILVLACAAIGVVYFLGRHHGGVAVQARWDIDRPLEEARIRKEEREHCAKNQKITEETSHGYQEKLTDLNARYDAAIKRLRTGSTPARVPTPPAPDGRDATAGGDGLPESGGAADLLALARAADKQTAQLIACQGFIRRTWDSR
ncbi:hypothetical protein TA3x_000487 [Tundrisphaera sp. TA3]|uniref:hypothetical protein n=1 Tax=Tundrisphaera sp. TA3 TaxID=3435775 RepID=UPI003EBDF610